MLGRAFPGAEAIAADKHIPIFSKFRVKLDRVHRLSVGQQRLVLGGIGIVLHPAQRRIGKGRILRDGQQPVAARLVDNEHWKDGLQLGILPLRLIGQRRFRRPDDS